MIARAWRLPKFEIDKCNPPLPEVQEECKQIFIANVPGRSDKIPLDVTPKTTLGEVAMMISERTGFQTKTIVLESDTWITLQHDETLESYGIGNKYELCVTLNNKWLEEG